MSTFPNRISADPESIQFLKDHQLAEEGDPFENQSTNTPMHILHAAGLVPPDCGHRATGPSRLPTHEADGGEAKSIETLIDRRNVVRVRGAYIAGERAARERKFAERALTQTQRDGAKLVSSGCDEAGRRSRRDAVERRAAMVAAIYTRAENLGRQAESALRQAFRNPHLFSILYEHALIHDPARAFEDLVKFGRGAGAALQVACVRILATEYVRRPQGDGPKIAFATFLAERWGIHPVTVRRLQKRAEGIEGNAELSFAGTIFDTQRDLDKLAAKAPAEQSAHAAHARANRTFLVLAGEIAAEARRRPRKTLFEAELCILDELGKNDAETRAFLYASPLPAATKWLADQLDVQRRRNGCDQTENLELECAW